MALEKRLSALGLSNAQPASLYGADGWGSALLAFLIEARLGVVAANYDGSLWEWSADPSLPLVK